MHKRRSHRLIAGRLPSIQAGNRKILLIKGDRVLMPVSAPVDYFVMDLDFDYSYP